MKRIQTSWRSSQYARPMLGDVKRLVTGAKERAQAGDLMLLSLPRDRVVEIISKQERGIRVRSLHASQAVSGQSEFVELVLSANSPMLGQPLCALARSFRDIFDNLIYVYTIHMDV